jgi:hypothetical protein
VPVGKNVVFEKEGDVRRVLVEATVCRPTYGLEVFLCRTHTKEHEAIVAAEVDARDIHKALLLAGAEPGSPVSYDPPRPPSGTLIKVSVRYKDASGKVVTKRAQEWIQDQKTKKPLDADWVFAGSQFFRSDEPGKPDEYLANGGDLIAVCSLQSAMLDLPIKSPTGLDERLFVINSDAIPPAETPVTVILEPVPDRKKPKK